MENIANISSLPRTPGQSVTLAIPTRINLNPPTRNQSNWGEQSGPCQQQLSHPCHKEKPSATDNTTHSGSKEEATPFFRDTTI